MKKILAIIMAAALLCCGTAAAAGEGLRDLLAACGQGTALRMKDASALPAEYSGYELAMPHIQAAAKTGEPDRVSEDGRVCYFSLAEQETGEMFAHAAEISEGPGGAILWMYEEKTPLLRRGFFVQRGKTLVALSRAYSRGAQDTDGKLENLLEAKKQENAAVLKGNVRWSPDGRYLFFNEQGKWKNAPADPLYVTDTVTGEIFLLDAEAGIAVTNGRFTKDSGALVCSLQIRFEEGAAHALRKYSLDTGTMEEIYRTGGPIADYCEMDDGRWMILEKTDQRYDLVRLSREAEEVRTTREPLPEMMGSLRWIPVSGEEAILQADCLTDFSCFTTVRWDQALQDAKWLAAQDLTDGELTALSMQDLEEAWSRFTEERLAGKDAIPGTSYISGTAMVQDSPYLLLHSRRIKETGEELNGILLLDTEKMKCFPAALLDRENIEFQEERLYADTMVLGDGRTFTAYTLEAAAD